MKKLLTLVSALTLLFTSCSSDDTTFGNRINKISFHGEGAIGEPMHITYSEENKILKYDDNIGNKIEFEYEGELIKKVDFYQICDCGSNDGLLMYNYSRSVNFEYDNMNRLIKFDFNDPENFVYYDYIEFDYVSVNEAEYNMYLNSTIVQNGSILFNNQNITSMIQILGNTKYTNNYLYDNKSHPFVNVKGFKNLMFFNLFWSSISSGISPNEGYSNNLLSTERIVSDLNDNYLYTQNFTTSYEYGNNNMPLKVVNGSRYKRYYY